MKLSKRLQSISNFVSPDATLIDVGCDHGWLGIFLVENNLVKYVYASDVAEGPLANATDNIKNHHLEHKIKPILSNGLEQFQDVAFSDIVIAGMGGSLIIEILEAHHDLLVDKNLILQPNNNTAKLRAYLLINHFNIIAEDIVLEKQMAYNIINARQNKIEPEVYEPIELAYGRYNLLNNNKLITDIMQEDYLKYQTLAAKVANNPLKEQFFKEKMSMIKEYLDGIK